MSGQLGGRLDAGRAGTHHGDPRIGMHRAQLGTQPLRWFQFPYGVSKFGYTRNRFRVAAADDGLGLGELIAHTLKTPRTLRM